MVPRPARAACAFLMLALFACSDEGPPSAEPGVVTVTLTSPAGPEGAALFSVAGEVGEVTMTGGQAFARAEGALTRVAMVAHEPGTLSVRMEVANIHAPPALTLVQVAGPDDQLRAGLAGYSLKVDR